jgi:predicted nucleic acid-binding protein
VTPQAVLVDTNVVSYLFRLTPEGEPFRIILENRRKIISFQTQAELLVWSAYWSKSNQAKLERWIDSRFGFLAHNESVTRAWVEVNISAKRNGFPISGADAWIAATALSSGIPLLTADKNDFLGVDGLKLLSV